MADALLGGIVINEVLVNPTGATSFDTDGNGTAAATDEYIELYNDSAGPIDISGLELWDSGIGNWFTFPAGTILQAGAHAMVMTGVQAGGSLPTGAPGDLFFDAGRGSAVINNTGDNMTVYDPASDTYIQATFSGDAQDNPPTDYTGFSATATQVGAGEDFGTHVAGMSLQRFGDGNDSFFSAGPTAGTTNICFADGTLIETAQGPRLVEEIAVGDLVKTLDHGHQPVLWTFGKTWSARDQELNAALRPVVISKGALGNGLPRRDLRVSQQHRVLVAGKIAQRMFGSPEVLVAAKGLLALPGVYVETDLRPVTYHHVMCGAHEVIFAEGTAAESLFLGREARNSIPKACLQEIALILGLPLDQELDRASGTDGPMRRARPFAKGARARRLVQRHLANNRAIWAA